MAKRVNYKGDKRRKETDRLRKQEEKRQRRFARGREQDAEQAAAPGEETTQVDAGESRFP